jgi:hypothetical protein
MRHFSGNFVELNFYQERIGKFRCSKGYLDPSLQQLKYQLTKISVLNIHNRQTIIPKYKMPPLLLLKVIFHAVAGKLVPGMV